MSDTELTEVSGACLCGKVTFAASVETGLGACYCGMCRQWSAGPFMSVNAVGPVTLTGKENIGLYSSSDWAERGFCNQCGSNLFYRLLPRKGLPDGQYIFSAGAVSDQSKFQFDHEVFVDHAPHWYRFADEAERKRMTEAELLKQFE